MHEPYFKSLDAVAREQNRKHGKQVMFVVPLGQAVVALREKVLAGKAPGLTNQSELFTDAIGHAQPPIVALSGYCHYAVIYGRSPVGLPEPAALKRGKFDPTTRKFDPKQKYDPKLNRLLQELAWEAVTRHPLSGVKK